MPEPQANHNDQDAELADALAAAFGDDAIGFLDDDFDVEPELVAAPQKLSVGSSESLSSSHRFHECALEPGDSPLVQFTKELSNRIYATAERTTEPNRSAKNRFVVFTVGKHQFGVPLSDVDEIARFPIVRRLPRSPQWLRGVTNLRGQIISVADLRLLNSIECPRPGHGEKIIVVNAIESSTRFAIAVDSVSGIHAPDVDQAEGKDGGSQNCDCQDFDSKQILGATTTIIDVDQMLALLTNEFEQ